MLYTKLSQIFSLPILRVASLTLLLGGIIIASVCICQSFPQAEVEAVSHLRPEPMDYFWKINVENESVNIHQIRQYNDYFLALKKAAPKLAIDLNGLIGYCYIYLNDYPKAQSVLEEAIALEPRFFWNYYNLAYAYIHEGKNDKAAQTLIKAIAIPPQATFMYFQESKFVYFPLIYPGKEQAPALLNQNLNQGYQLSAIIINLIKSNQSLDPLKSQEAFKPHAF